MDDLHIGAVASYIVLVLGPDGGRCDLAWIVDNQPVKVDFLHGSFRCDKDPSCQWPKSHCHTLLNFTSTFM